MQEVMFKIITQAIKQKNMTICGAGEEICARIYTGGESQKETVVLPRQAPALSPLRGHESRVAGP